MRKSVRNSAQKLTRTFARNFPAKWRARFAAALLPLAAAAIFAASAANANSETLRLATTTSVDNSGLLAFLLPDFERQCDCRVQTVVVGSGQALALGRRGDVDVLLTHSPQDEMQFVADGFAHSRRAVMRNYFVFVGPKEDPAEIAAADSTAEIMQKLAAGKAKFVSRGDRSGTHQKEKTLWQNAGISPAGKWYVETGAGMGRALLLADELRAYTLSDRGTYLAFRDKIFIREIPRRHSSLQNPYSVMTINAARHPHINAALAQRFAEWLTAPETQQRIGEYRRADDAETPFFPAATTARQ